MASEMCRISGTSGISIRTIEDRSDAIGEKARTGGGTRSAYARTRSGLCERNRVRSAHRTAPAGTLAINRFDAEAWYSGLRWQYWRDRLAQSDVAVTDICVGDLSLPA